MTDRELSGKASTHEIYRIVDEMKTSTTGIE